MNNKNLGLVLIDGENFLHRLAEVLKSDKLIEHKRDITSFDFDGFLNEILESTEVEKLYFGTRIKHQTDNADIVEKTEAMIDSQRRLKRWMTNHNIAFIQAGNLRLRETVPCRKCGNTEQVYVEKGVDVAIATTIAEEALCHTKRTIYLLSSDSDLLPALRLARANDLEVIYLTLGSRLNLAVSKSSNSTVTFSSKQLKKYYKAAQ